MTLHEALAQADAMTTEDRWTAVTSCGLHQMRVLSRTTTDRTDGPPYVCPVCWTVFGAGSCRIWNPAVRPRANPQGEPTVRSPQPRARAITAPTSSR
jgi:hypothetical protein